MLRINELISFAGLSYRVEIRLCEEASNFVAEYQPRYSGKGILRKHVVWIYLNELANDERDLETVIAHELCHAMQEEAGIEEWHGEWFATAAKTFEKEFGLVNVYDSTVDE